MSYVYRLAGEDLELAEAEVKGFLRSKDLDEEPERKGRLCFTESEPSQLRRLGLVHEVSEVIERTEEVETDYIPEDSFAVRALNLTEAEGDTKKLEAQLGRKLETRENDVDLEDPDEVLNLYILEDEYIMARRELDIDRNLFEQRKNQHRPFSSPVSLDPVLARVLVNLSEVSAGDRLLDPFCGTGGILIEAGLCGVMPCGFDIQEEMVKGARENLEHFGILNHDISQKSIDKHQNTGKVFDSIVTDLPYGKASKTEGNPSEEFLSVAEELTDGKIVFMYDKPELGEHISDFEIYVHKNLTRYIFVLE